MDINFTGLVVEMPLNGYYYSSYYSSSENDSSNDTTTNTVNTDKT